jgi:hypothetical protein
VGVVGRKVWDGRSGESLYRPWDSSDALDDRLDLAFSLGLIPTMLEIALLKERCSGGRFAAFWSCGIGANFRLDLQTSRPESLQ